MEKVELNNQIISCRPAIKRAKVSIIRKKIKKMKILKSCKKDEDREKKFKKAGRILQEVLLIKKVREDEVTKFALLEEDFDSVLLKTALTDNNHVYATLAKHPFVNKQITKLRESIPDYKSRLPQLLQVLGTRTLLKKWKIKNQGPLSKSSSNTTSKPKKKLVAGNEGQTTINNGDDHSTKHEKPNNKSKAQQNKRKTEESESEDGIERQQQNKRKNNESESEDENCSVDSEITGSDTTDKNIRVKRKPIQKEKSESTADEVSLKPEVKVADYFFVNKTVSLPKLLANTAYVSEDKSKFQSFSKVDYPKGDRNQEREKPRDKRTTDYTKGGTFARKYEREEIRINGRNNRGISHNDEMKEPLPVASVVCEEKLHPSWAAKKVKLIQPFQGKKIKFDFD